MNERPGPIRAFLPLYRLTSAACWTEDMRKALHPKCIGLDQVLNHTKSAPGGTVKSAVACTKPL